MRHEGSEHDAPGRGGSPRPGTRDLADATPTDPPPAPAHAPGEKPTAGAPADVDGRTDRTSGTAETAETPPRGLPDESSAERLAQEDHPLLEPGDAKDYRVKWQGIQSDFVDHPKEAVREADVLVAEVMRTLAASFASHKDDLERQWAQGEDIVTEDLRIALQRYRSFFNRLLSA